MPSIIHWLVKMDSPGNNLEIAKIDFFNEINIGSRVKEPFGLWIKTFIGIGVDQASSHYYSSDTKNEILLYKVAWHKYFLIKFQLGLLK